MIVFKVKIKLFSGYLAIIMDRYSWAANLTLHGHPQIWIIVFHSLCKDCCSSGHVLQINQVCQSKAKKCLFLFFKNEINHHGKCLRIDDFRTPHRLVLYRNACNWGNVQLSALFLLTFRIDLHHASVRKSFSHPHLAFPCG